MSGYPVSSAFKIKGILGVDFFKDVGENIGFTVSVIGGEKHLFREINYAAFLHSVLEIEIDTNTNDESRRFTLTPENFFSC